jgi:hypothetical protein
MDGWMDGWTDKNKKINFGVLLIKDT